MKILSPASLLVGLVLGAFITACGSAGLRVKIYYLDEEQGGLVRKQAGEVRSFRDSTGYRCTSPQDFDAILGVLKTCRDRGAIP